MNKISWKILGLVGLLSMLPNSDLSKHIEREANSFILPKTDLIASTTNISATLEETVYFENNPFREVNEMVVEGKETLNNQTKDYLRKTAELGNKKYKEEQEAKKWIGWMQKYLQREDVDKTTKSYLENKIISLSKYYGRVATNKKFKKSYDASLTKELIEKHDLDWTDCTKSVFEDFSIASNDSTIIKNYLAHVGEHKYLTIFPKKTAEYLHENGYELIYVAIDTKAKKWDNRYWAGGKRRVDARRFYKKVLQKDYYAPIDYVVKDKRVFYESFEKFLETTPAILFLEEFIHVGTNLDGKMTDAKWGSSPLEEENFRQRNLYELLTIEQENNTDNVRSMVMVVAKGSVQDFIEKYVRSQEYFYTQEQGKKQNSF